MIENLKFPNILIFTFGTLRLGSRLSYYMSGSINLGMYYIQGQLMVSERGSAYIDFSEKEARTIGELHIVNYAGLQRVDHLEFRSGEFEKRYNLSLIQCWPYQQGREATFDRNSENSRIAFFYERQNDPIKIESGDWLKRSRPMEEIYQILDDEKVREIESDELIFRMKNKMNVR